MEIKYNENMSKHTSFKTGGPSDYYAAAKSIDEIKEAITFSKEKNIPLYVMGNGSNLLVKDNGFRGLILKIDLENFEFFSSENNVLVTAGAGNKLMALGEKFKQLGFSGFEELSGIPGTIGGANYMNAGAYGKELKDILVSSKALNLDTGEIESLKKEEQDLVYRGSIFKNKKYIILESTIALEKGNTEEIETKMNEFRKQREEKQPLEYPSAGSTFKRGNGFITAKLIDDCGLKGYQIGGAQISEKHAGFIINKGNATSKDIIDLIEYTKKKLQEKFNVEIAEEIEIIGE